MRRNLLGSIPLWHEDAACKHKSYYFWGPEDEPDARRKRREAHALAICATCPVLNQCAEWATEHYPGTGIVCGGKAYRTRPADAKAAGPRAKHGNRLLAEREKCPCEICEAERERRRQLRKVRDTGKRGAA